MRRPSLPCRPVLAAAIAALAFAPVAASATALTPSAIFSQFNLVAGGAVSSNADIEGSAAIGGNFTGATVFNQRQGSNPVLEVYGQVSGNLNVNSGGKLYYGSLAGGSNINLNSGSTKQQGGFPNALADLTAPLTALSSTLSKALQQVGNTTSSSAGTVTFNATQADANGDAYYDFTASQLTALLGSNSNLAFSLGTGVKAIIVNVDGSFSSPSNLHVGSAQQNVLFNFYDAGTLTLNSWETSVLAPVANTTTNNAFEGFLFTNTLIANGELHNLPFNGPVPPTTPVPEPATLGMLAAGLAAVGALRKARRSRAG